MQQQLRLEMEIQLQQSQQIGRASPDWKIKGVGQVGLKIKLLKAGQAKLGWTTLKSERA